MENIFLRKYKTTRITASFNTKTATLKHNSFFIIIRCPRIFAVIWCWFYGESLEKNNYIDNLSLRAYQKTFSTSCQYLLCFYRSIFYWRLLVPIVFYYIFNCLFSIIIITKHNFWKPKDRKRVLLTQNNFNCVKAMKFSQSYIVSILPSVTVFSNNYPHFHHLLYILVQHYLHFQVFEYPFTMKMICQLKDFNHYEMWDIKLLYSGLSSLTLSSTVTIIIVISFSLRHSMFTTP